MLIHGSIIRHIQPQFEMAHHHHEVKLVQVSEQEVRIDFTLNQKCRANVTLTSLVSTSTVFFKVQTSSPHKFLVKPPTGLLPPLSSSTFQVILKPQTHFPPSFPRSPSDRFLIKTTLHPHADVTTSLTSDVRLKVAYVGPVLVRRAVECGDVEAVRNIVRRQRGVLAEMGRREAEELAGIATGLEDEEVAERMIHLLMESGLRVGEEVEVEVAEEEERVDYALCDRFKGVLGVRECGPSMEVGRRRVAATDTLELGEKMLMAARIGNLRDVEQLFLEGADISFCDQYGLTALHAAAIKGHKEVVKMLIEFGLDLESRDGEGHAPLHLAVVGGNLETVEMLIRNGANFNSKNKSGVTPLYMATAMGYDSIIEFLISRGG